MKRESESTEMIFACEVHEPGRTPYDVVFFKEEAS